ncbi:MAG: polysaccharide biosynthesis protein [Prevotella sp.]|nr:polysaccharide biosynthesis protein [Prevotella sp.]MDD7047289.1 glycosyltransferase [Prevotella sp.]MDY5545957.1 glycosyltransferase [Prevotella sp.]
MIPKKIHYCWLSNDPFPRKIRKCMDTWRKMLPDYEFKLWNTHNFDINSVPFVKQAYEQRKWAFAADYIRMYALYHEGGVYLDSDVKVLKPLDSLLNHGFMSSLEYHPTQIEKDGSRAMIDADGHRIKEGFVSGIQIQAAVMGAEKGNRFIADVLDWYQTHDFINPDGSLLTNVVSPMIYAQVAEKYGFMYKDQDQPLQDDVMIYRSEIFAGNKHEVTPASYAVHLCAHSWHPTAWEKIRKFFGK